MQADNSPLTEQPSLPFTPRILADPTYRPSTAQVDAMAGLRRHAAQLTRGGGALSTVLLLGPEGAGKTRLLIEAIEADPPLSLEMVEAETNEPLALFAEINRAAAAGDLLVIEARCPPDRWYDAASVPPDLLSRLQAMPRIELDRPGPDALLPVLLDELRVHDHHLGETDIRWVLDRLPRHFGAPRAFCMALDQGGGVGSRRELLRWAAERSHVRAPEHHSRRDTS